MWAHTNVYEAYDLNEVTTSAAVLPQASVPLRGLRCQLDGIESPCGREVSARLEVGRPLLMTRVELESVAVTASGPFSHGHLLLLTRASGLRPRLLDAGRLTYITFSTYPLYMCSTRRSLPRASLL